MSWQVLHSERAQLESEARARLESQVRLALWRLDSRVTPLIASEAARTHDTFVDPPDEELSPEIKLRFARRGDKEITSRGVDAEMLAAFVDRVSPSRLDAALPKPLRRSETTPPETGAVAIVETSSLAMPPLAQSERLLQAQGRKRQATTPVQIAPVEQNQASKQTKASKQEIQQQTISDNEYRQRKLNIDRNAYNYSNSLDPEFQSDQGWSKRAASNAPPPPQRKKKKRTKRRKAKPKPPPPPETQSLEEQALPNEDVSPEQGLLPNASAQVELPTTGLSSRGSLHSDQQSVGGLAKEAGEAEVPGELWHQPGALEIEESVTAAVWIGEELLLARRASAQDGEWIEGTWVDWPRLRAQMLAEISDLLPQASLLPVPPADSLDANTDKSRLLATLPLRLDPGVGLAAFIPEGDDEGLSAANLGLALAWLVVLFVLGATAALLRATLDLSERRGAFVSAVTHELRTPLTTFRMYTEMLSEGMVTDEEQRKGYIETLGREALRLDKLVQNVLTYARIEDERAQVNVEEHRIGELVESMEARLRERAEQAKFEFEIELAPELQDKTMRIDLTALEQILFNLVDNAAKYGRSEERARIEVKIAKVSNGRIVFDVRDFGQGIPADEINKVFRPFQKADEHAAGTLPGVGLGLALCRRLAEAMHGDLRLSDAKPGARFELQLPLRG